MVARAVVLVSGGLDGVLAARILQDLGLDVLPLSIRTGFERRLPDPSDPEFAKGAGLEHPARVVDATREFVSSTLPAPRHGYGPGMAPCIDCRAFMLRIAASVAAGEGAGVVATGEVLGQHPVSQTHAGFATIDREAGLEGRVLRPLSAQLLDPTEAERSGAVERSRLGRLHGRTRSGQEALARALGIEGFSSASRRCCRLVEEGFARRVRDLADHADLGASEPAVLSRLHVGRHLRIRHDLKMVVSRNDDEGRWLEAHASGCWIGGADSGRGAVGVVEGNPEPDDLARAAGCLSRYLPPGEDGPVAVVFRRGGATVRIERPFGGGGRVL